MARRARDTLIARLEKRENDVSDADAVVLRTQQAQDAGEIKWHTIDASQSSDVALEQALTLLRVYVNDAAGV